MNAEIKSVITVLIIIGGSIYLSIKYLSTVVAIVATPMGLAISLLVLGAILFALYKLIYKIFR